MNGSELNRESVRILIIKPSSLGDIFHALPAVGLLLKDHPDAEIDWLINPAFADALKYCPNLHSAIPFPRRELGRISSFIPAFFRLYRQIRAREYDLIIDLQGLFRSAIFGWFARSFRFAGFAVPREKLAKIFYNDVCMVPEKFIHAVDRNCFLASHVMETHYTPHELPPLQIDKDAAKQAESILQDIGIQRGDAFIGVMHDARWESKCWPEDFFVDTLKALLRAMPELKAVILGAPSSFDSAERIASAFDDSTLVVNLAGKTDIPVLAELLRYSSGVLCNDSGPMHIAAAVGTPVFGLFGPTDPERTGPYGTMHLKFQPDISCIKCLKRSCPECEEGELPLCHRSIDPIETAFAIANKLNSRS